MDKRIWINVGLLAFIVLLSAILFYSGEEPEQELPRLSTIDRNSINQIEIIRKDLDDFIFNKEGETWAMRSPLQYKANNARINAMLRMLKAESHGQLNPAEVELKRFDLADPVITMKLNDHEFKFGNTDAIDQHRYVMFNNSIHLTNDFLYSQLTTNAAFFADTKLLPIDLEIGSIRFPDNQIDLVEGQWQMQNLIDINPEQLKRIAFNWANALAISVSRYAEPETESLITVSSTNDDTIEFVIVSIEPHLILGRKDLGIQYHLGSDEADKLLLKENQDSGIPLETTKPE